MKSPRTLATAVLIVAACVTSALTQGRNERHSSFRHTYEVDKFDTVNLQNLNVMFPISIAATPAQLIPKQSGVFNISVAARVRECEPDSRLAAENVQ